MVKERKPGWPLVFIAAWLFFTWAGCAGKTEQDAGSVQLKVNKTFINIASGDMAGAYYPLGKAIAEILNQNAPDVNATVEATGSSAANIDLLRQGQVQIAFAQSDIAYYAVQGTEMFKGKKIEGLTALAAIYPKTVQLITLADNNIKSLADLQGKKVAVGAEGSSLEVNVRQIMAAEGLSYDDIDEQYRFFAEAADDLKKDKIQAGFMTAEFPNADVQELADQHEILLIPLSDAATDQLVSDYPFYGKMLIPAGTYQNQGQDVKSLGVKVLLVVTDDMDEQLAYDITKAICSNLDTLKDAHSVEGAIMPAMAKEGLSIPIHPGAEKYFNR